MKTGGKLETAEFEVFSCHDIRKTIPLKPVMFMNGVCLVFFTNN